MLKLAGAGLLRRPAKERAAIIEMIFRPIIDKNLLEINRDALDQWADPAVPSLRGTMPGHRRVRKKQNVAPGKVSTTPRARYPDPRQGIQDPRQGIQDPRHHAGSI